jgi:RND family efflux transporter MFP subunit
MMPNFLKTKKAWIIAGIILIIIIIIITKAKKGGVAEFSSSVVERSTLIQSVSETGSVSSDLELEYGWETNGRVANIFKKIGDPVKKNDLIANIENSKQRASVAQAAASWKSAQASLDLKLTGVSDEEIQKSRSAVLYAQAQLEKTQASSQASINTAQKAYETALNNLKYAQGGENSEIVNEAYEDLVNKLKTTLATVADSLTEIDNILGVDNTLANDEFESYLGTKKIGSKDAAQINYLKARNAKNEIESNVFALSISSPHKNVDSVIKSVQNAVLYTQTALLDTQNVLTYTNPVGELSQSELDALKTGIATVFSSVNTAGTSLTDSVQAVSTAKNSLANYEIALAKAKQELDTTTKQAEADVKIYEANLAQAQAAYDLLVAKPREIDVASLRAEVNRTAANLASAQSDLQKTELRALSDGILAKLDVEIGENITANASVIKILSQQKNIEVDISESDIAKVQTRDPVEITLDAFGDETVLSGEVVSVEPAETEISGVVYYKVKIVFTDTKNLEIKSGMTANIKIMTDKKENAIFIPQRAVIYSNGDKYVRILTNKKTGKFEKRTVETGIRGDGGMIEILSGLNEKEEIITFLKEN